ncbi:hypothetical protein GWP43_00145 [Treponema vincentii]|jgi:hypothetical protein|uniref:Uncharacterized protein n=1 Tax=Treponema vincentii TaxID=69710 RepID=A0A6P1XXI5_9SPIR|nr:hypothetical protein [Treponema vincentii]QHX42127.1 hypothetical protein GWP43_00145 [Treponema vincentii]
MILFVFEGKKQEPRLYKTMEYLFFNRQAENEIIVSYCSNIYSLYQKMTEYDVFGASDSVALIQLLKEEERAHPETTNILQELSFSDEISEIYLFFDYDIKQPDAYNRLTIEEQHTRIKELLCYFNNETDKGKLYINYPMVESIRYFKNSLPDNDYKDYTVKASVDGAFKALVNAEACYKNLDFICFGLNNKSGTLKIPKEPEKINSVKENWRTVKEINVKKAHFICVDSYSVPQEKSVISQQHIFDNQLDKYVNPNGRIAILNAFPLFLYEYYRV